MMNENRSGRNCPFPDSKSCKMNPRGYIASAKNVDDNSVLLRWKDIDVVI